MIGLGSHRLVFVWVEGSETLIKPHAAILIVNDFPRSQSGLVTCALSADVIAIIVVLDCITQWAK